MMINSSRLPIRVRVTVAFAVVMLILLAGIGLLAYQRMGAALLDEIDSGLRFKASAIAATESSGAVDVPNTRLQEPREAFEQFLSRGGRVLRATEGFDVALVNASDLARVSVPTFLERDVAGVVGPARLLVVPLRSPGEADVLVVGTSMADRTDALHELAEVLLVGGPAAVLVACVTAAVVAGWALNPMDRMRRQAAAITESGLDRRMTVPAARDELQRLALTLNDMLDRLAQSIASERGFLERASHELRTPLAALRTEVDLALGRDRSADELTAALRSVSEETDRLTRLAEDLLVLARAQKGRLPLHREAVSLRPMLESATRLFSARAAGLGIELIVAAPETTVLVDPLRIRQALVNLLDNALRHTPRDGIVRVTATPFDLDVRIAVVDNGPGFPNAGATSDLDPVSDATGLGLRIVRAVAASHGGTALLKQGPDGGASVELVLPGVVDAVTALRSGNRSDWPTAVGNGFHIQYRCRYAILPKRVGGRHRHRRRSAPGRLRIG